MCWKRQYIVMMNKIKLYKQLDGKLSFKLINFIPFDSNDWLVINKLNKLDCKTYSKKILLFIINDLAADSLKEDIRIDLDLFDAIRAYCQQTYALRDLLLITKLIHSFYPESSSQNYIKYFINDQYAGNGMYGFVNPLDSTLDTNNKKKYLYYTTVYFYLIKQIIN